METKDKASHPAGPDAASRIAARLRNSGDTENVQHVIHKGGDPPTRTYTNIHHSRVHEHGKPNPGEGDIHGHKRGVVSCSPSKSTRPRPNTSGSALPK